MFADNSSSAKSDMDMAYERARVHLAPEDAAGSPTVAKVGLLLPRSPASFLPCPPHFLLLGAIPVFSSFLGNSVLAALGELGSVVLQNPQMVWVGRDL